MHQQAMLVRWDIGDAAMTPLEVQRVWRDHALERLERRPRRSAPRRPRNRVDDALHGSFVGRSLAVGPHRQAGRLHPGRHILLGCQDDRLGAQERQAGGARGLCEKPSAMDQSAAGDDFEV